MSAALKKSPLARVKDEFGGKDKLVDKIVGVLDSGDESKEDLRKRLLGVANGKLIRLHTVATRTKAAGGHDKLAAAAADKLKHGKDKDFVAKLEGYSVGVRARASDCRQACPSGEVGQACRRQESARRQGVRASEVGQGGEVGRGRQEAQGEVRPPPVP
jgi:hypothetical protein